MYSNQLAKYGTGTNPRLRSGFFSLKFSYFAKLSVSDALDNVTVGMKKALKNDNF